jgi:hypothetical protein
MSTPITSDLQAAILHAGLAHVSYMLITPTMRAESVAAAGMAFMELADGARARDAIAGVEDDDVRGMIAAMQRAALQAGRAGHPYAGRLRGIADRLLMALRERRAGEQAA